MAWARLAPNHYAEEDEWLNPDSPSIARAPSNTPAAPAKYQSASGNNTFKARTTGNWKDGNVSGFATSNL
jgi:hypothetical protein